MKCQEGICAKPKETQEKKMTEMMLKVMLKLKLKMTSDDDPAITAIEKIVRAFSKRIVGDERHRLRKDKQVRNSQFGSNVEI